eukprot:7958375-Alexandrium_andersonii.AAC.1
MYFKYRAAGATNGWRFPKRTSIGVASEWRSYTKAAGGDRRSCSNTAVALRANARAARPLMVVSASSERRVASTATSPPKL